MRRMLSIQRVGGCGPRRQLSRRSHFSGHAADARVAAFLDLLGEMVARRVLAELLGPTPGTARLAEPEPQGNGK
jgi:hypothetical protein